MDQEASQILVTELMYLITYYVHKLDLTRQE